VHFPQDAPRLLESIQQRGEYIYAPFFCTHLSRVNAANMEIECFAALEILLQEFVELLSCGHASVVAYAGTDTKVRSCLFHVSVC